MRNMLKPYAKPKWCANVLGAICLGVLGKTIIATFIGNPHLPKPYAARLNAAYKELENLITVLAVKMELSNVVETVER